MGGLEIGQYRLWLSLYLCFCSLPPFSLCLPSSLLPVEREFLQTDVEFWCMNLGRSGWWGGGELPVFLMLTERIPSVRSNHSQLPDLVADQETANGLQIFSFE